MFLRKRDQFISLVIGTTAATIGTLFNPSCVHSAGIGAGSFRINVTPTSVAPGATAIAGGSLNIVTLGTETGPFTFTVDLLDSDAPTFSDPAGGDDFITTFGSITSPAGGLVNLPQVSFTPSNFTGGSEGNTIEVYGVIRSNSIFGTLADISSPTVNVTVVPEPLTFLVPEPLNILGSGMALGFAALMERQYSRKRKKTKKIG